MNTTIPFVKTFDGFTAVVQNKPYNVSASHENYDILYKSIVDGDEQRFVDNLTPDAKLARVINNAPALVKADVKFVDGEVMYKAIPLAGVEVERIKQYAKDKIPFEPILRFVENRMENPSPEALAQLYVYMEKHQLPLTTDGCFLAYKAVRQDWMDKYSGTVSNHIGAKPNMKREAVDSNADVHCSQGLHVGALAYSGPGGWYWSSGDRVVICKINPRDVISVPNDHNRQKMRVCEYEVVAEYEYDLTSALYNQGTPMSDEDYDSEEYDYEEYEDEDEDDVITREKVSAYETNVGDFIEFTYNGTARVLEVDDTDDEHVSGVLQVNPMDLWGNIDTLLDDDDETMYRTFKKERMRGVYKLV
jgi:hypothetical protein